MTKVRAFGKVILFGEHAVVYGYPAIAAALDRGVEAEARASQTPGLFISPWDLSIAPSREGSGPYAQIAQAFAALLEAYGPTTVAQVDAFAAIPAGAGLGCSAALGVAIVKALDDLNARERSLEDVVNVSLAWERVFHGNPSGIDSVLAARGGVVRFARGQALVPIIPRDPLIFAVASTAESASTKSMVDSVARQREKTPARVEQTFEAIGAIVNNAHLAIEQGDAKALGQLLDMNHTLLSGLMLSTTRLEALRALAKDHHALGAKLTGSGGGGALIALCPEPREERAALLKSLSQFSDDVFEMTVRA